MAETVPVGTGAVAGVAAGGPATAMLNVTGAAKIEVFELEVTVMVTMASLVEVDCACNWNRAAERNKAPTEAMDLGLK